eukprot:CAMPEP_0117491496 /NCGR_PEP_ID=MMETSP0784-20121206/18097_1 /TAXON_ID=39447 /ORGANISM="" /LENGTH=246 /DNA_ID=CAMNT_0005286289 /DNA_START=84 /DNA_END=824 /DNA_ORIENTATION=-
MFSFVTRSLARKAPSAIALAGGVTLATVHQRPQTAQCKEGLVASKNSFRVQAATSAKSCPISVGKKFLQLYFAEFSQSGEIDLHQSLNFTQAKTMLMAAGAKGKDVKEMFEMMDTDNSNSVDFVEIMAFFLNRGQGTLQEKGSLFFHACDIDGSSSIEQTELKDIIHHMMMLKKGTDGTESFMQWHKTLYANIPESYVLHFKANELVNDIFAGASKNGDQITEKDFQTWLLRGGKEVNRLISLFGL